LKMVSREHGTSVAFSKISDGFRAHVEINASKEELEAISFDTSKMKLVDPDIQVTKVLEKYSPTANITFCKRNTMVSTAFHFH